MNPLLLGANMIGGFALDAVRDGAGKVFKPLFGNMVDKGMQVAGLGNGAPSFTTPQAAAADPVQAALAHRVALRGPLADAYNADPETQNANGLLKMGSDTSPAVGGPWEALARAVAGGLGGYSQRQVRGDYEKRQVAADDTLQKALAAAATNKDNNGLQQMQQLLAGNPDLADTATKIQLSQIENQLAGQKELEKLKLANALEGSKPITPYQQAQLDLDKQKLASGSNGFNLSLPDGTTVSMGGAPGGGKKFMDTMGANLADRAVPKAADDNVPKLSNTLTLIEDAKKLNNEAYDGMVKGPATQMVGRIMGDEFLKPDERKARDAYSNLEQKLTAIQAEAIKPIVGGAQISDADVNFVGKAVSVMPKASRAERANLLNQISEVMKRKRDLEALGQEKAQKGQVLTPQDIAGYYQNQGIDYASGERIKDTQTAAPLEPPGQGTLPGSPQFSRAAPGQILGAPQLTPQAGALAPASGPQPAVRLPALKAKYGLQ